MQKKGEKRIKYYQIRVWIFWGMIGVFILLIIIVYSRDKLYEKWLHSQKQQEISYAGRKSKLQDQEECYLCGNSNESLVRHYINDNAIGIISLNDWYVKVFELGEDIDNGQEFSEEDSFTMDYISSEKIVYRSDSIQSRGLAKIEITLPNSCRPDIEMIENHLCQKCLDKVLESMEITRWRYEKKEPLPLCIVDFKTLEIYSLQDWHTACSIREYWVEIEHKEEMGEKKVIIGMYYLPYRE